MVRWMQRWASTIVRMREAPSGSGIARAAEVSNAGTCAAPISMQGHAEGKAAACCCRVRWRVCVTPKSRRGCCLSSTDPGQAKQSS